MPRGANVADTCRPTRRLAMFIRQASRPHAWTVADQPREITYVGRLRLDVKACEYRKNIEYFSGENSRRTRRRSCDCSANGLVPALYSTRADGVSRLDCTLARTLRIRTDVRSGASECQRQGDGQRARPRRHACLGKTYTIVEDDAAVGYPEQGRSTRALHLNLTKAEKNHLEQIQRRDRKQYEEWLRKPGK